MCAVLLRVVMFSFVFFIVMLSVIVLSVVMLNVFMLSVSARTYLEFRLMMIVILQSYYDDRNIFIVQVTAYSQLLRKDTNN